MHKSRIPTSQWSLYVPFMKRIMVAILTTSYGLKIVINKGVEMLVNKYKHTKWQSQCF